MRRCWNRQNYLNATINANENASNGCTITSADTLPEGWNWHCWNDGSGHIESPDRQVFFQYDLNPYENCGEIEYKKNRNSGWTTYEGGLTSFRQHAEELLRKQLFL